MGRTACTEPQCLYKGALYLYLYPKTETAMAPTQPSQQGVTGGGEVWAGVIKPSSYTLLISRLETSGALRPLIHDMHRHFTLSYAEYQRRKHGGCFIKNSASECIQATQQFANKCPYDLEVISKLIFSGYSQAHAMNISSAQRINGPPQ